MYIPPVLIFRNSASTHRVFLWVSYDSNNKRSNTCKGKRFFFPTVPRLALEPIQPPSHWVLWFFHGVKQPGLEALHYQEYSAMVEKKWKYTSAPLCVIIVWNGTTLHFLYLSTGLMDIPFICNCNRNSMALLCYTCGCEVHDGYWLFLHLHFLLV